MPFKILIALVLWTTIGVACNTSAPPPSPIEFRRTGGIVGLDDQLTIDEKGHAELTRRAGDFGFDLAQGDFARLTALLRDANFKTIPEDSRRKPYLVPDEISYVIVYQGHTVKTSDTAIPDKLQAAIQLLNGIVDARGE
ncbi:MAG: hypothetical protein L0Y55_00360 [Anaerolineales bacterium]|nr:hypothetical protein [Anaerolineales bacterium]